ncbi:hypothetical protein [Pseudomaricurvus sp. HS19]|uniref:hypothetical protein n=1 Tax=Pseudomaricurvus sp. HS19 TaxID=2692626 RepID=UPI0013686F7C|nr:hypothetical protein [Pseudomaricurvus sp. HS19]MYM64181.1 hypothetical protein [Pseudomaricurvus sp. HS19]
MKKLLLIVLGLHIALETLMGGVLVVSPQTLMPDGPEMLWRGLIVQGMCALATVVPAIWVWRCREQEPALNVGLIGLASFHSFIILSLALTSPAINELPGYTHHLLLAIGFWVLWARRHTLTAA